MDIDYKEVTATVKTRTAIYTAFDGTEFDSAAKCRAHEKSLMADSISGIETIEYGYPPFDGQEHMENHEYYWYKPKNEEEIKALSKYHDTEIDESYIGEWINIEVGYYGDNVWVTPLDDCIHYAKDLLEKLGYNCKISKEG